MTIHPFFLVFQAGFLIKAQFTLLLAFPQGRCFVVGVLLFVGSVVWLYFFFCGMKKVEAFAGILICNTRNSAANITQTQAGTNKLSNST